MLYLNRADGPYRRFSPFLSYIEESLTATMISLARNRLILYSLLVLVVSADVHTSNRLIQS